MATTIGDITSGMKPLIEGDDNTSNKTSTTSKTSNTSTSRVITPATGVNNGKSDSQFSAKLDPSLDKETDNFSNIDLRNMIREYENPLLEYHNYTYHFKLYALSPDDFGAFTENDLAGVQKEIIAETGVTGRYSINSVQMVGVSPGTPGLTSNHSINNINIELIEQNGMHLYDDLIVMSNLLGYDQFCNVPLILELDFIGYDQDSGVPEVIAGYNRKWSLLINNVTTTTDKTGGSMHHMIQATSVISVTTDQMWTLPEPFEMTASTFGEAVDILQKKLVDMAEQQYGYLQSILPAFADRKYYEFFMDSELRNLQMQGSGSQAASVDKSTQGSAGVKKFAWKAGTTIATIIDDILDGCFPVQPKDPDQEAPIRVAVNIVPLSLYCGQNPILNKHAFKYKFFLVKYKIGDVLSSRDLDETRFTVDYFYKNAEKITDPKTNSLKLNAKTYYYQFSGLNKEIIDLEIKFDGQFFLAVSRNPEGMRDPSNSAGTHAADDTITYGNQVYKPGDQSSFQDMWKARAKLEQESRDGKRVLTDEDKQFIRDVDNANAATPQVEGESEQRDLSAKSPTGLNGYIEDYRETFDLTEMATNGIGSSKINGIPLENVNISQDSSGTLNDSEDPNDQERRMAKDNYYNRSFLNVVNMRVIGDPFWLGYGDKSYVSYLKDITSGQSMKYRNNDVDFANFITSEAYFLLVLKPVVAISDDTGLIDTSEPSTFSESLYRINKVTHDFSGGKFQQTLEAALCIRALNKTNTDNGNQLSGTTPSGVSASQSSVTK